MSMDVQVERAAEVRRPGLLAKSIDELSHRSVFVGPALLCAVMLLVASTTAMVAKIDASGLILPYMKVSVGVTFISVGIFAFLHFAKLAMKRADDPVPIVLRALRARAPLLLLPALIFPVFLIAYTTAKTGIPFLVGYTWDGVFAEADRLIFGRQAWRITHGLFGAWTMPAWEWLYRWAWGLALVYSVALIPLYASGRTTAVFYTAMFGTWILGGWLMAYAFSATGPIFVHLADSVLAAQFQPMRDVLDATLAETGVRTTQAYLENALMTHVAVKGAGISAMPSMHLGATSIYVLASRGTKWMVPALVFWMLIFIGSAHLGYHYWIDGIVAAGIAWLCWTAAEAYYCKAATASSATQLNPA